MDTVSRKGGVVVREENQADAANTEEEHDSDNPTSRSHDLTRQRSATADESERCFGFEG
jgi:hypothetical protein